MESNRRNLPLVLAMIIAAALCTLVASAQDQKDEASSQPHVRLQHPLNLKPGLWESTVTVTTAGEIPIPPEILNRLTPEQRARMEARMKASAAAHSTTDTNKKCVSKEDIAKADVGQLDKNCTYTIATSTSTEAKGTLSCDESGMTAHADMRVQAPDPEHMKGSAHGTMTGGGHTLNVDSQYNSKWLGSDCGDVK